MIIEAKTPMLAFKAIARAFWAFVTRKPVFVSNQVADTRKAICSTCYLAHNGQCLECTCFIDTKVLLATEKCPLGRWHKL